MDLGKLRLPLGSTYSGTPEQALQDLFTMSALLQREINRIPGTAVIEASATVDAGKAVNINNGLVRHADAATNIPAVGICVKGATIGQKATIMLGMGYISGLTGLTANTSIYLGNAGVLLFAKPGAGFIQGLGYALSTTELFVTIAQP